MWGSVELGEAGVRGATGRAGAAGQEFPGERWLLEHYEVKAVSLKMVPLVR